MGASLPFFGLLLSTTCHILVGSPQYITVGQITELILQFAKSVPVELFVFLGSILEEIIAPIPSPLIMTTAGLVAESQGYKLAGLLWLALIGAFGKTVASIAIYKIADKAEDILTSRFGKYLGISHKHIEALGSYLSGSRWDDVLLAASRAIPIMPTFVVSFAAGAIKYNLRSFLVASFIGLFIRNVLYLAAGSFGASHIADFVSLVEDFQYIGLAGAVFVGVIAIIIAKKGKAHFEERVMKGKNKKESQ